jgi:hypothetical protein
MAPDLMPGLARVRDRSHLFTSAFGVLALNARLPETKRFARQGWHPAKSWDFYSAYWRSGLSRQPMVWQAMLSAAMLVAAVAIWTFLAAF